MLCLSAGAVSAVLAVDAFTLAWTHSIEKIRWEEDWRVAGGTLVLEEARIRGTGAGMEPPEGAVLKDGVWHYRPAVAPRSRLSLAHSPFAAGYEICADGRCRPLAALLGDVPESASLELSPCEP